MSERRALDRRQQRLEELSAASVRALAGDARLGWRREVLHRGDVPIPAHAPHLRVDSSARDLMVLRGIGDAQALRVRYSDFSLFRQTCPEQPVARLMFELLEQLRVETHVPEEWPGVATNVRERFLVWSRGFNQSGLTETTLGIMLYTVVQMVWSRLNARPVLPDTEDLIEATRASVAPLVGTWLAGLRRYRHDQQSYAAYAYELARFVADSVEAAEAEHSDRASTRRNIDRAFALLLDFDEDVVEVARAAPTGQSRAFQDTGSVYRVFTTRYDEEVDAGSQVRSALLKEYRTELDGLIEQQGVNRSRLRRLLLSALATPHDDGRRDGEEEGLIDGRRLAQLVSSPTERRVFTQQRVVHRADCAVTFLIDCSGSMRDQIRSVAILVDSLVRALERVGATTEVLGFTTRAWNGGQAYREWMKSGRPAYPGRLNEICHRVFKPARRTWRQSRTAIAAMFKPDLFREGIDGEAVQWAAMRLLSHDASRRVLVVISDGCPMDTATALTNDEFYLDNHLKQVVAELDRGGQVDVVGVGVGLDLSPFYRRNVAVDVSQGLPNQAIYDVAALLRPRR